LWRNARNFSVGAGLPLALPQHPDQHRPERPILLAVDQELGEGATLRMAPDLADPVGAVEVAEPEDVEQLGAGSGAEGVEALPESALQLVGTHLMILRRGMYGRVTGSHFPGSPV
jgi:hypothetical protein